MLSNWPYTDSAMAKIRLGGVVAQASGSLDGITFSHNRNGPYVRARRKPTNPKTVKQTAVRSQFTSLAQQWRTLGSSQRTQWAQLGAQMQQTNSIGAVTTLTGLQAFTSVNQLRLTAGLAVITGAPVLDTPPLFTPGTLVSTVATGGTLTIATTTIPGAGQTIRVYATGNMSAGRNFIRKSQYRFLTTLGSSSVSPIDLKTVYQAAFGTIASTWVGAKISFLFVPVSANGIAGTSVRVDGIWS